MARHGSAGLGQVGGLVCCGLGVPVGVPLLVSDIDRGPYPGAGFAEVVGVGFGPEWVADICLLPIVATR